MELVHTFWSLPLDKTYFDKYADSLRIILLNYAFSVACCHKSNQKIKLFTDEKGAKLFDFIPYDKVNIIKEFSTNDPRLAANIKFEALKRCTLNDVIIDGDLFLRTEKVFDTINDKKEDLVCSFIEPQSFWKDKQVGEILDYFNKNFKSEFNYNLEANPFMFNTSMIKFNSQKLKDQWIEQYYKCLKGATKLDTKLWLDLILEQIHLTQLVIKNNYSYSVIAENFPTQECNDKMLQLGFCHLGAAKKDPNIIKWIFELCEEYKFDFVPKLLNKLKTELS